MDAAIPGHSQVITLSFTLEGSHVDIPLSWWCQPPGKYCVTTSGVSYSDRILSTWCFFLHSRDWESISLAFSTLKSRARKNRSKVVSLGTWDDVFNLINKLSITFWQPKRMIAISSRWWADLLLITSFFYLSSGRAGVRKNHVISRGIEDNSIPV